MFANVLQMFYFTCNHGLSAKLHYTRTPATDMFYNTTNGQAHNKL